MGLAAAPNQGETFLTTTLDTVLDWGRKHSLYPMPFGTACCAIEFMSSISSVFDIARFGSEVLRFSPRQADLLLVSGTINYKQAPILKRIYDQMPEPKWVISMGACACSGGFYNNYCVVQGIDQIVPVDVYIAGCPPRPEAIIEAIMMIQNNMRAEENVKQHPIGDAIDAKQNTPKMREPLFIQ
jgi:NADH-quinone oxidoreductase subunit B